MRLPSTLISDDGPLGEESEAGMIIADVIEDDLTDHLEVKRFRFVASVVTGVIALSGGVYLASSTFDGLAIIAFLIAATALGYAVFVYRSAPDVEVKSAEKRLWTSYLLPQSGAVVLFDGTGVTPYRRFELESLENQDQLRQINEDLEQGFELPILLPQENNLESTLQSNFIQISETLTNTTQEEIQVPIISQDSKITDGVASVQPHTRDGHLDVDSITIPLNQAQEDVGKIEELESLVFEDDVEQTFTKLKEHSQETLNQLTETHQELIELLNDSIESVGDALTIISYNFYCPVCLRDEISTELDLQVKGDTPKWYCDTCRKYHDLDDQVPMNRIKDDLVDEIWDRLWIEKDDEKRAIYEEIEDQQTELKEREFEQKQEIIRNGWNRIKDLRSKIRDLETEAAAGKGAVEEIGEVMVKYDRLREERRNEFQEDVIRAVERVDEETERVLKETRNFEQRKTEQAEKEAEQRAEIQRTEEQRRHRERLAVEDGGLGIRGTIASKIHRQKMKMKRQRIESVSGAEDWGEADLRNGIAVETRRPVTIDSSTARFRSRVIGVTSAEQISVYFEWRDVTQSEGWLQSRDRWRTTDEQLLASPDFVDIDVTDLEPDSTYEIRAVAEVDGEQYSGETLIYPDDATTETDVDVESIEKELSDIQTGDTR